MIEILSACRVRHEPCSKDVGTRDLQCANQQNFITMNTLQRTTGIALAMLALGTVEKAAAISYPDFSNVSGLTINGNAAQAGNVLRLTPAAPNQSGSAFSTTTVPLNNLSSFSTRFQFQITGSGGIGDEDGIGADGLVFVVQTAGNNVGGAGGGIGYVGVPHSVGIEFDTYNNGAQDGNNGNHLGVDLNGDVNSVARQNIATRFNDGNVWTAWVDYNGNTGQLEVRANETGIRPAAPDLTYTVDLASILGTPDAYVGFTAGTGSGWGNHDILNWEFLSDYNPIGGVPDSGNTVTLLLLGCLGIAVSSRNWASARAAEKTARD